MASFWKVPIPSHVGNQLPEIGNISLDINHVSPLAASFPGAGSSEGSTRLQGRELHRKDGVDVLAIFVVVGALAVAIRSEIMVLYERRSRLRFLVEHLLDGLGLGLVDLGLPYREVNAFFQTWRNLQETSFGSEFDDSFKLRG
jgi:hypothetical protein